VEQPTWKVGEEVFTRWFEVREDEDGTYVSTRMGDEFTGTVVVGLVRRLADTFNGNVELPLIHYRGFST
jgi:hypothetical protein